MSGSQERFDAVIVGGRCAGSPLALRLAEAGWSVLLVDREPPPADTTSTHFLFPNTIAVLERLGVLARIRAAHRLNPLKLRVRVLGHDVAGGFTPIDGIDHALCITRPVLDEALLATATDAGARTRFGEKVTGLLGTGSVEDPVRGVELADGTRIEADWVFGADGRASTVAGLLGLEKQQPLAGEFGILYAYWRGLPTEWLHIEGTESRVLTWGHCEDDVTIATVGGPGEFTRGNAEERRERLFEEMLRFPESFDRATLSKAELIGDVRVAPETMLRGFFRDANGPGWALVGDAGHFKHPSTAQGISDAIEQALHVAGSLTDEGDLDDYREWRDRRAEEHYEWSFSFARFPRPEADALFSSLASDAQASQDFRDGFARLVPPQSGVFTEERLARWFSAAGQTPE